MSDNDSEKLTSPFSNGTNRVPPPGRQPMRITAAPTPRHVLRDVSEYVEDQGLDRLHIPRDMIPAGFDLQWITVSVFGQPQPQHRARFERKGWVPVHSEDWDSRFRGMFLPESHEGEIEVDGLVLMARPMVFSDKARRIDQRNAQERTQIKERQLRGGHLDGVTLDTHHETVINRVEKHLEPVPVPP